MKLIDWTVRGKKTNNKSNKRLGNRKQHTFDRGIEHTIDWTLANNRPTQAKITDSHFWIF